MSKIKALINPVTPFAQNAPIIYCENTKQCAFVDPGGDIETLIQVAHENELIPAKILLTHGHADHAGGATELSNTLDIAIIGPHEEDLFLLQSLEDQGRSDLELSHGWNNSLCNVHRDVTTLQPAEGSRGRERERERERE